MISDSPPHHPSPALSKRHSYLTKVNHDIFAIHDSPSPSKYIDAEDMLIISDSQPRSEAKTTFPIPAVSSVDNQPDSSFSKKKLTHRTCPIPVIKSRAGILHGFLAEKRGRGLIPGKSDG